MTPPTRNQTDPKKARIPNINLQILHFLWTWKVATTAALHVRFSPDRTGRGFYSRLWRLRGKRLIQMKPGSDHRDSFWCLDKKGFQFIRDHLPPLKEEGFLSEYLGHDLLVSAIHLGDGLFGPIDGIEYFTEQQLRRIDPDCFPTWVPQIHGHRPDGFWRVKGDNGRRVIAVEVELHQKATRDYGTAAYYYSGMDSIDRVLWITPTPSMAKAIQRGIIGATDNAEKHNFVMLSSIYESGWNAVIALGPDSGKTVSDLIAKAAQKTQTNSFTTFSLDTRRTPYISTYSRLFGLEEFSY